MEVVSYLQENMVIKILPDHGGDFVISVGCGPTT